MSTGTRTKSPQTSEQKTSSSGNKITDLYTLRALQKAAKQLNSRPAGASQGKEPRVAVTDDNQSEVYSANRNGENLPFTIERSRTEVSTKQGKTPEDEYAISVRTKFQQALSKLYASETKDLAMSELKNLISRNSSAVTLRYYISSLCEYKKVATVPTQECEVYLFGYLAEVFQGELVDPRDKPPSLVKTCLKLIESVQGYFNVSATTVQQSCAKTTAKYYTFSLLQQPIETKVLLLYEPLGIIITGGTDRISQATAGLSLSELITAAVNHNDKDFLEEIRKRYLTAFLKINYEIPELIKCIAQILYYTEIRLSGSKMHQLLPKLSGYLKTKSTVYQTKVEAAQALRVLGVKLRDVAESFIGNLHEEVLQVIKDASKDRIIKVQNAAGAALREWNQLKKIIEDVDLRKKHQEYDHLSPEELIKSRTGLGVNEALQENYSALADSLENVAVRQMSEKPEINVSWDQISPSGRQNRHEPNKRYVNFQKKKSGTGGGFVVLDKDKRVEPKTEETHHKQRQNIKDIVMKNMDARGTNPAVYDSKFEFFFPNQKSKQGRDHSPETNGGSRMRPQTAGAPGEGHSQEENVRSSLKGQSQAKFNPKLKSFHDHLERQILNEASNAQHEDEEDALNYLNESSIREKHQAQAPSNVHIQDQAKETRGNRGNREFRIRTQPNRQPLNSVTDAKSPTTMESGRRSHTPKSENELSHQNTMLGDTTMAYDDEDDELEATLGYDDAEIIRASGKYGNSVPSEMVRPNPRLAYEDDDPKVKPERLIEVSEMWEKVLESLDDDDIQTAYDRCLESGDDLYLLRLMVKTGPCIEKLHRKTAMQLTNKIIKILNSQFMAKSCLGFFEEFMELELIDNLTLEEQNNMLKMFYELSAEESTVGVKSAELYSLLLSFVNQ